MITVTVGSSCTIAYASPEQRLEIMAGLTLNNPLYVDAKRQGRYYRNIDPYLKYYSESEDGLTIPRGFTGSAMKILNTTDFVDRRRSMPPVNFTFSGALRPYQRTAVEAVLKRDLGYLVSGTGSGKTTVALYIICTRQQPTLVIVPTVVTALTRLSISM